MERVQFTLFLHRISSQESCCKLFLAPLRRMGASKWVVMEVAGISRVLQLSQYAQGCRIGFGVVGEIPR